MVFISIDYNKIRHLSEKEFNYQLELLKEKQKELRKCICSEIQSKKSIDYDQDDKKELNKNRDITSKTPPVRFNLKECSDDEYKRSGTSKAVRITSGKSFTTSIRSGTPFWNLSDDDDDDEEDDDCVTSMTKPKIELRSKSSSPTRAQSPSKSLTIPKPFKMTQREEENKMLREMEVARRILSPKEEKSISNKQFKANDVPLTSKIPLYNHIVEEQEHRLSLTHQEIMFRLDNILIFLSGVK